MEKEKGTPAKQKIMEALEKLLQTSSLDDIYVSDIIREAKVARKTFYRHYQDKYDLTSSYFEEYFQTTFEKIISGRDWEEALLMYLTICEEKAAILVHAYDSKDTNGLHKADVDMTASTYSKYLKMKGADVSSADMKFAIRIASCGGTDMILEWLIGGMSMEKSELVCHLKATLPQDILKFLY